MLTEKIRQLHDLQVEICMSRKESCMEKDPVEY